MNAFDNLMALGMAQTTAIVGQKITVGPIADVSAVVGPIRREERLDGDGNPVWVDAGDIAIGRANWPDGADVPSSGQRALAHEQRRRARRRVRRGGQPTPAPAHPLTAPLLHHGTTRFHRTCQ